MLPKQNGPIAGGAAIRAGYRVAGQRFDTTNRSTAKPDDPLFGIAPDLETDYGLRLGLIAPRGERGVLTVPIDQFMRLNCNPFFPYQEARIRETIRKK